MRALGCALAILVAASAPAGADILKVFGEVHGGAMGGKGTAGDQKDEAFFANAPHGMYGLKVGVRFLVLEAQIQHHQYRGDGLATWTQFSAGLGIGADLGDEKQKKAHKSTFAEVNAMLGAGLGTGRQVDPPLSNDEITDKGVLLEGRFSIGKHLGKFLDFGVAVTGSWGYFLKNGIDDTANDVSTHYQGMQFEGIAYLRLNIKLL